MASIIYDNKILAPKVLTADGVNGLSVIEIVNDRVVVAPFQSETFSTTFIPSPVAVLKSVAVTEFLLDDIEQIVRTSAANQAVDRLHNLFLSSALYADIKEGEPFLLLSLS